MLLWDRYSSRQHSHWKRSSPSITALSHWLMKAHRSSSTTSDIIRQESFFFALDPFFGISKGIFFSWRISLWNARMREKERKSERELSVATRMVVVFVTIVARRSRRHHPHLFLLSYLLALFDPLRSPSHLVLLPYLSTDSFSSCFSRPRRLTTSLLSIISSSFFIIHWRSWKHEDGFE